MPSEPDQAEAVAQLTSPVAAVAPVVRAKPSQLGSLFADQLQRPVSARRLKLEHSYPWLLLALDALNVTLFFGLSILIRYEESLWDAWSLRVYTVLLVTCCLGLYMIGGYHHRVNKQSLRYSTEHLLVSMGIAAAAFLVIYVFIAYGKNMRAARTSVTMVLIGFTVSSLLYRRFLDPYFRHAFTARTIDVIGSGPLAQQLRQRIRDTNWGYRVRLFSESPAPLPPAGSGRPPILDASTLPQLPPEELAQTEAIVLTGPPSRLSEELRQHLLNAQFLHGLRVYTYDSFVRSHFRTVPVETLSCDWTFTEGFRLSYSPAFERLKRCTDLLLSSAALVLLAPLMAIIALLIKLTSKGPVFFVQERVGRCEKPFQLLKFRSMRVGAERGDAFTQERDTRITPIGRFLRNTHLDELPQLINVLRGEMSLVGPRAEWRRLVDEYEKKIPHYHYRHLVKPGITGWAQVNYPYGLGEEDAIEKLRYDLYYVRHHSLLLDFSTLLKTAYTVLFAKGR